MLVQRPLISSGSSLYLFNNWKKICVSWFPPFSFRLNHPINISRSFLFTNQQNPPLIPQVAQRALPPDFHLRFAPLVSYWFTGCGMIIIVICIRSRHLYLCLFNFYYCFPKLIRIHFRNSLCLQFSWSFLFAYIVSAD